MLKPRIIMVIIAAHCGIFCSCHEVCDTYLLMGPNITRPNGLSSTAPNILGHRFEPNIVQNSFCVNVISCLTPGSRVQRELMMAFRFQRSLSWKLLPCVRGSAPKRMSKSVPKGCQRVKVGYFVLDPYVIPNRLPLDGADIRAWSIAASKLNLCANFTGGKDPTNAFGLVASGAVELIIGQLPYTWLFHKRADFANSMGIRIVYLGHRIPQPVPAVWTIIYPFDASSWTAVILGTVLVCLFLLLMNFAKLGNDSPLFHIVAISLLSILSESFPGTWFGRQLTSQVRLALFTWLPMSFLLGNIYRSSLLQFLVAGEVQDPADTFDKILERNLVIAMPTGTVIDQLFKTSPFESMRLAYELGEKNGGFYPWGQLIPLELYKTLLKGDAVSLLTDDLHVGRRHIVEISKVERLIGYMPKGFMFKMNSKLRRWMEPILFSLTESGIYEHLKQIFLWHRAKAERIYYTFEQPDHLVILKWEHVGWSFLLVVCSGLAFSTMAFLGEVHIPEWNKHEK